ncbi:hypothetical protein L9F63_000441 [Diploptera punctata]|uniref:Peptidase C1A papain C-terminal domain-containing protein n=1 Tax=Diploptera punctata TaxID=6984 RepID=A0AAD8ALQ0_DIPPU|nr:hypothetical protein L9F63_000441 [Diploptera punctata]
MILGSSFQNCPTLREIRDQGACGSCWSVSPIENFRHRICIHSNGKNHVRLSAVDLISCCNYCGNGCHGGDPYEAWNYWMQNGIVSGGPYNSNQGCRPYEFASCDHIMNGTRPPCGDYLPTPGCIQKCEDSYNVPYGKDLNFGSDVYSVGEDETQIQLEILKNGPVETDFVVYEDFLQYKSGVYQHEKGGYLGGHAVKILGWGVDKTTKTPYWIIANSWNSDWGENGYFRMLRGRNECLIESGIVAGIPKLNK